MAFSDRHLYLSIHWTNGGGGQETGQVGLRFDTTAAASQSLVDGCAPAVQTFWSAANSLVENDYKLQYLRLASIGLDGHYFPGTTSYDHNYPGGVGGGGPSIIAKYPLQVSTVSTLTTAFTRGLAHSGRIYLPWLCNTLGADYKFVATYCNGRSVTLATMIDALNAALGGTCSVFSSKGTGTKHPVTGVKTGTRPDVQRRRAKALTEGSVAVSPTIAGRELGIQELEDVPQGDPWEAAAVPPLPSRPQEAAAEDTPQP